MTRTAEPGELSDWPTAENGEMRFVFDDGGVQGFVAVSRIMTPVGEQCWIHDCEFWGENKHGLAALALATRKQIKEWGFDEFRTNVLIESPMLAFWQRQGLIVEQCLMKGTI